PFFNQVIGKSLTFAVLGNPVFIGGLVLLLVLVGLLSGSYPALVLSRFQPAIVLKGQATLRPGSNRLRQALVVAQFTLSIGLIIASLIVAKQLDFIQKRALGFNQDHLVVVDINDGNSRANFVAMKNDLASSASVQSVSVSSNVPGDWKNITQIEIFAPDIDSEQIITSHFLAVDGDFLDTFEIGLREGRNITDTSPSDSLSVLVNASAAQQLGLRVGDRLAVKSGSLSRRFRDGRFEPMVVGIVENFHFESLHEEIGPIVLGYYLNPIDVIDYFTIRIDGQNVSSTLEHLRTVGQKYDPRHPFEYNFLDDRIADFYDAEAKLGRIFNLATVLAVLIACLGLLGLTAIMTTQRTKEIGLRKVLGASVQNIIILLSKEILLLVIVSFVLALPPSYLLMSKWLEGFAYRTHLGVELSLITLLLAIFVAVLTVSYQTLRAATADPVKSLRYE
ncbi:MAG: FtsX-like permease family protein, partial [Bacteroidetes bacterium]